MEPKDYITISGILATLIISITTLISSRQQRYISSITKMRGDYLVYIRDCISKFLAECRILINAKRDNIPVSFDRFHEAYNLILLNLSDNHDFDKEFQECMTMIYNEVLGQYPVLAIPEIERLLLLSRRWFKMEWEGIKFEIKHGRNAIGKHKEQLEKTFLFPNYQKNINSDSHQV